MSKPKSSKPSKSKAGYSNAVPPYLMSTGEAKDIPAKKKRVKPTESGPKDNALGSTRNRS